MEKSIIVFCTEVPSRECGCIAAAWLLYSFMGLLSKELGDGLIYRRILCESAEPSLSNLRIYCRLEMKNVLLFLSVFEFRAASQKSISL